MKKIAVLEWGYDDTCLGVSIWLRGQVDLWKRNYDVDLYYIGKEFCFFIKNELSNYNKDDMILSQINELDILEEYDYVVINNMGRYKTKIIKKNFENYKHVFENIRNLKNPVTIYVNHDRAIKTLKRSFVFNWITATDYTITYFPEYFHTSAKIPKEKLLSHHMFPSWRNCKDININYQEYDNKEIDLLYMANPQHFKLTLEFMERCKEIKNNNENFKCEMAGFTGFIAEREFKEHPNVIRNVYRKEERNNFKNSKNAFIPFYSSIINQEDALNKCANSKFSWCVHQFSLTTNMQKSVNEIKQLKENEKLELNQTFEGSVITCLFSETIPILSYFYKDFIMFGKTVEEWGFSLFYDFLNPEEFVKNINYYLNNREKYDKLLNNLKKFKEEIYQKDYLSNLIFNNLEQLQKTEKMKLYESTKGLSTKYLNDKENYEY